MLEKNILEIGAEVFIKSSQLFGVITYNDLSDFNYKVVINGDTSDKAVSVDYTDLIKVLQKGTLVQIKDTAFSGVILGDDRDLPVENLDGFNYWIGNEENQNQKLLVHHNDIYVI